MNVKKDVVYYEAPAMECIEMACEGVLCGSSLKPGESEVLASISTVSFRTCSLNVGVGVSL